MSSQIKQPTLPLVLSEEEERVASAMRKCTSQRMWQVKEGHFRNHFGESFATIWAKAVLVSGVAEEMFGKFEEVTPREIEEPLNLDDINISPEIRVSAEYDGS